MASLKDYLLEWIHPNHAVRRRDLKRWAFHLMYVFKINVASNEQTAQHSPPLTTPPPPTHTHIRTHTSLKKIKKMHLSVLM